MAKKLGDIIRIIIYYYYVKCK